MPASWNLEILQEANLYIIPSIGAHARSDQHLCCSHIPFITSFSHGVTCALF